MSSTVTVTHWKKTLNEPSFYFQKAIEKTTRFYTKM